MADSDQDRLPPATARRVQRARRSSVRCSLLSVGSHTGLGASGLVPVGDVTGAFAAASTKIQHSYGRCASRDAALNWVDPPRVVLHRRDTWAGVNYLLARPDTRVGFSAHLTWLRVGWDSAHERMLQQCRALKADGVVGVTLTETRLDSQHRREFTMAGTAVRSHGPTHLDRPFSTTLAGHDVSKLTQAGYMPASVIVAIAAGMRHNDPATVKARRFLSGNVEVSALTELVNAVRAEARRELTRRLDKLGADGAILAGEVDLEMREHECDYVAEARLVADAVVDFAQSSFQQSVSLPVLPLL